MRAVTEEQLSEHIEAIFEEMARTGEEVFILRDGLPVARIEPITDAQAARLL